MLEIKDLHYSYSTPWVYKKIEVLRGVSLSIREGEVFGFLGSNGAGKTTTIRCILGLSRPTKGEILVEGVPSCTTRARAQIGYLAEQPYYYDHLTVEETLSMYAGLAGVPSLKRKDAVYEALGRVNLRGKNSSRLRTLSKGLTQRVGMAQAIIAKPRLLILDEPFSGLDPIGRREFRELILSLKKEGTTIFMSSHILSDVELICDRASVLSGGELKALIELSEIETTFSNSYELVLRDYKSIEARVRELARDIYTSERTLRATFSSQMSALEALRNAADSRATIVSYSFSHPSLEEIFMGLVKK